jgi:adenosine deaminase
MLVPQRFVICEGIAILNRLKIRRAWLRDGIAGLLLCVVAATQVAAQKRPANTDEARTSAQMESLRSSPPALYNFLREMPKGADLHMHLSGAVYAETFLQNAAEDHLCADPVKLTFVPNIGLTKSLPPQPVCPEGAVAAAFAFRNQKLYDALIDSFSMRSFVPSAGWSGHDQFFATFARFGGTAKSHQGEWVDELVQRSALQNEQYLELMTTPDFSVALKLAAQQHWDGHPQVMRDALLAGGLRDNIAADRAELDDLDKTRNTREHCADVAAASRSSVTSGPCSVQVRYLYQVLRSAPPERVFAQTLLGFELASVDPRVVGINFVQPEDAFLAMSQYSEQMKMMQYLHSVYPKVHISLHAGELAPGMVPPDGLRFHIAEAVNIAGAERIGHGVDVMYESSNALLKTMADKHIMVEVNLTSNDVILGIKGSDHPLHNYMAAGVPFALSTDDEGVSRIDLTHEYVRAALEQGLTYAQLKASARTSLEHSFLPGESLWVASDQYTRMQHGCSAVSMEQATGACADFLHGSERARQQAELERRLREFESHAVAGPKTAIGGKR